MSNSKFVRTCNLKDVEIPKKFPAFEKPSVTGYFSVDTNRSYYGNTSQLKYVHVPSKSRPVKWDLNVNFEKRNKKNEVDEKIDNILRWILEHKSSLDRTQADIVCYRGLLTLIMGTPYENNDGWTINATKWNGVIYLCESPSVEKVNRKLHRTPREERYQAWGYKFEQYMSSDTPGTKPCALEPCKENEEFCVVFRTKLNEHKILYGAEMDGIESSHLVGDLEELQDATFVELKTNRLLQHPRQRSNFRRYKLLKWWCQSFVVGIKTIVCGFRDDNGVVREVEVISVPEVHKEAKFQGQWDPLICMTFCDAFLTLVRAVVEEDTPDTVFRFIWEPSKKIEYIKFPGPSTFSFLHKWYTDEMGRELMKREQLKKEQLKKELLKKEMLKNEQMKKEQLNKELMNKEPMDKELMKKDPAKKELKNKVLKNGEPINKVLKNGEPMNKEQLNRDRMIRERVHKERINREEPKRDK